MVSPVVGDPRKLSKVRMYNEKTPNQYVELTATALALECMDNVAKELAHLYKRDIGKIAPIKKGCRSR